MWREVNLSESSNQHGERKGECCLFPKCHSSQGGLRGAPGWETLSRSREEPARQMAEQKQTKQRGWQVPGPCGRSCLLENFLGMWCVGSWVALTPARRHGVGWFMS